jgi:hypothetical protein
MKHLKYLIWVFLVVFCFSCKKDKDIFEKDAIITWHGEDTLCGYGFLLKIGGKDYKAQNESIIDDCYKEKNKTRVKIKYKLLNKQMEYYCYDSATPMKADEIELILIKKEIQ